MTKTEWFATLDPLKVFMARRGSARKQRLLAVGCCRQLSPSLADQRSQLAVDIAEQYAERAITAESAIVAEECALAAIDRATMSARELMAASAAASCLALWAPPHWGTLQVLRTTADLLESGKQVALIDCVFGLPQRSTSLDPRWRTADVLGLARGIYEDRAFDRLPLLADALMDAGCADEEILAHCRSDGPHVRGCWVVDLVLDKE
jgi:hypothetical protein